MNFYNEMEKTSKICERSITENGAIGYKTSGKALLDLNFAVPSLRNASENEIFSRFMDAMREDSVLAMKWLFFARDVRGGLGERRLFRVIFKKYAELANEKDVEALIPLVAEYGRYDDLWELLEINDILCGKVCNFIKNQLIEDIDNYSHMRSYSLLAKWLPSENASSEITRRRARIIIKRIGFAPKDYRKMLTRLRKGLDIVEVNMSAKNWSSIDYSAVPSKANLIYNGAFLRNDEARRREFLDKLIKGEVKINSNVVFPHEIVHKYTNPSSFGYGIRRLDSALEGMWKQLPNFVDGSDNSIVVADGSGSMTVTIDPHNSTTALEVANALAIYFAEHSSGQFKDKYITFSSRPQFVDFSSCHSLREKIVLALAHSEVANTNIEAVFDLILDTAVRTHASQEDMPKNIIIISDMEFDHATCTNSVYSGGVDAALFETIRHKYEANGYMLPRLVFWNVNSRTNTIPIRENECGVALVSGFSPNICKMVLSGKLDPYECLCETLNSSRYDAVAKAIGV